MLHRSRKATSDASPLFLSVSRHVVSAARAAVERDRLTIGSASRSPD